MRFLRPLCLYVLAGFAAFSLSACGEDFRLKPVEEVAISITPAAQARIESLCDATLTTDNLAAARSYVNLYMTYVQPLAPEKLPVIDLDRLTSRETVVRLADARTRACDLYAAGTLFGVVETQAAAGGRV